MYIKFCRNYGADKKDEASELPPHSKLSVELEGEKVDKKDEGSVRWYRIACILLLLVCLILLLLTIVLGVKLQTGSTLCPNDAETMGGIARSCSLEQCQGLYPRSRPQCRSCKQCPRKWLTFGDSCFYLSRTRHSWDESQQYCSSVGGTLAAVDSRGLQDFLTKQGKLKYWIGLKLTGASWSWTNGMAVRQSYWQDGTSEGDCALLDTEHPAEKNWVRDHCQSYAYFVCQQLL